MKIKKEVNFKALEARWQFLPKSCGTGPAGGLVQQRQQQLDGNRQLIA